MFIIIWYYNDEEASEAKILPGRYWLEWEAHFIRNKLQMLNGWKGRGITYLVKEVE